jgi:hypothetical protein
MRRLALLLWSAAMAVAGGCSYAPKFESNTLSCGPGSTCPEGYLCGEGKCWTSHDLSAHRFVGQWVFTAPSALSIACTDGTTNNLPIVGDMMAVLEGTDSDLLATYYCPWDLDVAGVRATLAGGGQTCPFTSTDGKPYKLQGKTFGIQTTDGQSGMSSGMLLAESTIGAGNCNLNFSGSLVKAP